MGSLAEYSVPEEAKAIFQEGILDNPLMKDLPSDLKSLSQHVKFEGSGKPSVPMNWRFAESISALKALEATMLSRLLRKKYSVEPADITINTDHASLFFMSAWVAQFLSADGKLTPMALALGLPEVKNMFPDQDRHRSLASFHRALVTNIYKTKDGKYYQVHGGINPDHSLKALGLPLDGEAIDSYDSVVERIQTAVAQYSWEDLDELMNEKNRQAGTIAWSSEEYFASEHGKANEKVGLYEITKHTSSSQPASWWPENDKLPCSPKRPLAGLKVVDLTRIIAGPSVSRGLAEMGASVMRVTGPAVTDVSFLHQDLNWGKWNCHLNLDEEADREQLRALIREADVVVDGYRPGVMAKHGFGRDDVFDLVRERGRGIVHLRENCYGWHGPWQHRSGWQQNSDAAMGSDEAVAIMFPTADYGAGVCGSTAVLDALMQRAENGGSYGVDVSLNYYSQWLVRSCGTYPERVWKELWERHGSPKFRRYHGLGYAVPTMLTVLHQHDANALFQPRFFEMRESKAVGGTFFVVKPVAQFSNGVELRYNVGTRGNGVDRPAWPADLSVEVVKAEETV